MPRIALTRGLAAEVDELDFERLRVFSWSAMSTGSARKRRFYAVRYERLEGKQRVICMHREITGAVAGEVVDHRDGNTLNKRQENLRRCSQLQNVQHRRHVASASGFKGVWRPSNRKTGWEASIRVNGVRKYLGCFPAPEEAARAYDAAAVRYFGEFAATNADLGRFAVATDGRRVDSDSAIFFGPATFHNPNPLNQQAAFPPCLGRFAGAITPSLLPKRPGARPLPAPSREGFL